MSDGSAAATRACTAPRAALVYSASGPRSIGTSDRFGKHVRSIFPDTGFITKFSTRKILVGIDGAGTCPASVAVTRAVHSAGAGLTFEIAPSEMEGATTKATSVSFW